MITYTPDDIRLLEPRQVFVFGSNTAGNHFGGAAWTAHRLFGAKLGVAFGMTEHCFAIPTCTANHKRVQDDELLDSISRFLDYVSTDVDHDTYLVTRIGCGIAHWQPDEVRKLFWKAVFSKDSEQIWQLRKIILPKDFLKTEEEKSIYFAWQACHDLYLRKGENDELYANAYRSYVNDIQTIKEQYVADQKRTL